MHVLRSVGVLSFAKIMGAVYGCLALVFAPVFVLMGVLGVALGPQNNQFGGLGMAGMFVLAVLMPVFYGVFGFIFGAIGALLYNLFAKWVGGLELNLEAVAVAGLIPPAV